MRNWSTDVTALQKDKERYAVWKMEQLINFGLDGEKLDRDTLRTLLPRLQIDPARRKLLELLLQ